MKKKCIKISENDLISDDNLNQIVGGRRQRDRMRITQPDGSETKVVSKNRV